MSVDLRGFDYALAPLQRQHEWRRDAARARVMRVRRQIAETEAEVVALRERHRREGEALARSLAQRVDPGVHRHMLDWLGQLHSQIRVAEQALSDLRAKCDELLERYRAEERKLDLLDAHRKACLEEFVRDAQNRLAAQADRDWLSRQGHVDLGVTREAA